MQIDDMAVVLLDLKYCERCGGLWLRERGSGDVLCRPCSLQIESWFEYEIRRGRPMLPGRPFIASRSTDCNEQVLVCSPGGHA